MRAGIFAKTFEGDAPGAVLQAAKDAGFGAVQYNFSCSGLGPLPLLVPPDAADAIRAASETTGVAIAAVSATYNMIHPDPTRRATGRASFAAIAESAGRLGTHLVTLCSGSRDPEDQWRRHPGNDSSESWDAFVAEMRLLLPVAERHGVTLGIEPETANVVSSPARARKMLDLFRTDRIGIVLDPANLFETEEDFRGGSAIDEAVDLLGGRVVLAHAKDRDAAGRIVPAGRGLVDFPRFVRSLSQTSFDGDIVAHGISDQEATEVAGFLGRCLDGRGRPGGLRRS